MSSNEKIRELEKFSNRDFNRGASRIWEFSWYIVRAFFFLTPIPLPSAVRTFWLRIFGATIGQGVVVRGGVNISFPWRLKLANNVWLGDQVTILSLASVEIESDVCISQQAFLCTGSHDFKDQKFGLITKPIKIEHAAWIAARCFIGPGVTIGRGAVCAAGSIIMTSVHPLVLVAGNPAAQVRKLDS